MSSIPDQELPVHIKFDLVDERNVLVTLKNFVFLRVLHFEVILFDHVLHVFH